MAKSKKNISFSYIEPIFNVLTEHKHPLKPAYEAAGIKLGHQKALSLAQYNQLIQHTLQYFSIEQLAFLLIEQTEMTRHDLLGLLVMCGITIKHAIKAALKFYRLQINFIRLEYEENATHGKIIIHPDGLEEESARFTLLMAVFAIAKAKQDLIGIQQEHDIIHLPFDKTRITADLDNFPQMDIVLHEPYYAISIPKSALNTKIKSANQITFEMLQQQCEQTLAKLSADQAIDTRVTILLRDIKDTFPDLNQMAGLLAVSSRTLSRQLKSLNTNYQSLLESEKINRSKELLKYTDLSITDIANQLYFSDSSYFTKVFKKNVGESPSAYRKLV